MFSYLRRGPGFYGRVCRLAVPIILQNLITSTLAMADTFMVGMMGEVPMAAVTLANIPLFVLQLFFFGVQSGSAVLISQYWGRQDRQAINRVVGVALWAVNLISVTFALVLLLLPVPFLSLFGNQQEVIRLAADYGRIIGLSYVLNGITLVYVAAWRSMERRFCSPCMEARSSFLLFSVSNVAAAFRCCVSHSATEAPYLRASCLAFT